MKNCLKKMMFFVLIVFCFSCKQEIKNKAFINKLATIQNDLPSPNFSYRLYFKLNNNEILETNVNLLYDIYKNNYSGKYDNFDLFLIKIFELKEVIKIENLNKYNKDHYLLNLSKLDTNIEKMDVITIAEKYFEKHEQSYQFFPKKLELAERQTILFKMFTEGYVISLNDYIGYYSIVKYKEEDFK